MKKIEARCINQIADFKSVVMKDAAQFVKKKL